MQNEARVLVGAATRYIAGRNAMQTVYWRTRECTDATQTTTTKLVKLSKTFAFGKIDKETPPIHMKREQKIVF